MSDLQARRADKAVAIEKADNEERRSRPRLTPLVQPAKLICGDSEYFCIVRDASENGMKIHHFGHLPPASDFLVQLTNGESIPVSVVWANDSQAGVRFDSSVDIARIVSLALGEYPRRPLRINTSFSALLGWQDEDYPAQVTNLSVKGARVTCEHYFALDQLLRLTTVFLRPIYAKVRWRRHHEFGLVFETTLGFEELAEALADINAGNVTAQSDGR